MTISCINLHKSYNTPSKAWFRQPGFFYIHTFAFFAASNITFFSKKFQKREIDVFVLMTIVIKKNSNVFGRDNFNTFLKEDLMRHENLHTLLPQ